jgi:hypothetical protein
VRRLYNEASYNYNSFRTLNINDEILEEDVTTMFFRASELLTLARDNSRNAQRICSHIGDIEFAQYINPNITLQQAIHNRREALEERRLAIEAYNDATRRTHNYEQSNRSRRLRGIISPTYTTLLTREDSAANEVTRTRAHVTNSNNVLRRLSNLRVRN